MDQIVVPKPVLMINAEENDHRKLQYQYVEQQQMDRHSGAPTKLIKENDELKEFWKSQCKTYERIASKRIIFQGLSYHSNECIVSIGKIPAD